MFLGLFINSSDKPKVDIQQYSRALSQLDMITKDLTPSELNTMFFAYEIIKRNLSTKKGLSSGLRSGYNIANNGGMSLEVEPVELDDK
jgi:hypothetical protein